MKKAFFASILILVQSAALSAAPTPRDDEKEKDDSQNAAVKQETAKQGLVATTPAVDALSAPIKDSYFPQPAYFRKRFDTPSTKIEIQPPVRLPDYVVNGKLELSLKNYLDLVFSNNYDISVQKLLVQLNRNAITRAYAVFDPTAFASFSGLASGTLV